MNPFISFLLKYFPLSEIEQGALEDMLEIRQYSAGDIILNENSICRYITFILKGKARSYFTNYSGQEFTWSFYFNDADSRFENYFLLDYNSFLQQTPTHLNIEAIEDIECIRLSHENLQSLRVSYENITVLNSRMSEMAYQNVHKRAFSLLTLPARERYMQLLNEEPGLLLKFRHYHIASYLGIAPQSLSRLRNELARE